MGGSKGAGLKEFVDCWVIWVMGLCLLFFFLCCLYAFFFFILVLFLLLETWEENWGFWRVGASNGDD